MIVSRWNSGLCNEVQGPTCRTYRSNRGKRAPSAEMPAGPAFGELPQSALLAEGWLQQAANAS
jgi:hypothetical protein